MENYLALRILQAKNNKEMADAIIAAEKYRRFKAMARNV